MRVLAAALLLIPLTCTRQKKAAEPLTGVVEVKWSGAAEGRFIAPGDGQWCRRDTLLELTAIRGDTGIGLALVEKDTIKVGQHPVVAPSVSVDWRPLARGALRWLGPADVRGFEATGGNVHITELAANTISGRIDVRMSTLNNRDTLRVVGTFTKVPMRPDSAACGRVDRRATG